MLAKLKMKLNCKGELAYQMSSLFHGALMELLLGDYAEKLHLSRLHPYAQHLEYQEGDWYWVVCCLNREAAQKIIHDTLWNLTCIHIKKREMEINIVSKSYEELAYRELLNRFYEQDRERYIQIHFVSPTAFKQRGEYVFYPELRCIFQSLMNKYDAAVSEETMRDEDTLKQLCENAKIIRYDLRSVAFSLEGIKVPAFIGKITIKMSGTQTMTNFANMLFQFGAYSGVGIKTALGMGCIQIIKGGENYADRQADKTYHRKFTA